MSKIWIDPATGFPLRCTQDEILADGTTRRLQEMEEIEVNIPLDDALFEPALPADFKVLYSPVPLNPPPLDPAPVSAGYGGKDKLEVWHALRITDRVALVVWRRSKPEPEADGGVDWLKGMTIGLFGSARQQKVRHDWLFQSHSPDVWNWSLVAVEDGVFPDRGGVSLDLRAPSFFRTTASCRCDFPSWASSASSRPPHVPRCLRMARNSRCGTCACKRNNCSPLSLLPKGGILRAAPPATGIHSPGGLT